MMKSLEKDRARRYETASALLCDLQHHLDCEPVSARPPTRWYRGKKLLRRHGKLAALLATVALALVAATVVSTSLYVRMRRALHAVSTLESQADVDRRLSAAQRLYGQGQHLAALKELEATLGEQDPGPRVHLFHAQLLVELQRSPEAQAELLPLTQAEPEIAATAHYLLARANIGQDRVKAAEHEALATSMLPETAEAYVLRAMTAANQEEALAWLDRAVTLDASHYPARKVRALIYYCRAEDEKAVEDVAALTALRPKHYLGYALRAVQRREAGQLEAALVDHERALSLCEDTSERVDVYDQRYATHVRRGDYASALQDARRLAELCPEKLEYRMYVVLCLLGLEDYGAVQREYRSIVQTSRSWDSMVRTGLPARVFRARKAGQTFRVPSELADKAPFAAIRRASDGYDLLARHAVPVPGQAQYLKVFCWSPDGKQLLCGRSPAFGAMARTIADAVPGLFGGSSLRIIDVESGQDRYLPADNTWFPAWSPDGKHLAFSDKNNNLCLVAPAGGPARIVARGKIVQWSQDSQHLYFRNWLATDTLCCLDLRDPNQTPVKVTRPVGTFLPCDERGWMAFGTTMGIEIVDLASGSVLHRCPWLWPRPQWPLHRSPNGKELSFASWRSYIPVGPLVLDTETKDLYQVLDHPADQILWSPDGSKIAIVADDRPWVLDADPHLLISQRLGQRIPGGDLIAYEMARVNRAIAADPLYPENYLERAVAYLSLGRYPEAESDLRQFEAVVTKDDHHIGYELFWWLKECYDNSLHEGAARLEPYAEKFIRRFPADVPSFRPLIEETAARYEREGKTELAGRWKAKLKERETQGD
ncbi:MAG: hypothetical protein MUE60_13120 [Candidatus Eisenbacteria bacterium]|nr:hypothetical protein [Candidatus Eisenbacteria bacterium]